MRASPTTSTPSPTSSTGDRSGSRSVIRSPGSCSSRSPLAARCRVERLGYVCAFVPVPGRSLAGQWRATPELLGPGWDHAVIRDQLGRTA